MSLEAAVIGLTEEMRAFRELLVRTELKRMGLSEKAAKSGLAETSEISEISETSETSETKPRRGRPPKEAAPTPAKPTLDEVKAAAVAYSEKHGRPAVYELLAKFGVKVSKELPEKNWAEFILLTKQEPVPEADDDFGDDV
jgi:hypothetical protein